MEFTNANESNAELDRELKTTRKDLRISQAASKEDKKYLYVIRGAVRNINRQMDDTMMTAVKTVRLRVDRIPNPSVPISRSAPGDVQGMGEDDASTNTRHWHRCNMHCSGLTRYLIQKPNRR